MKIYFIGGGNMAEAMIAGITSHGYNPKDIIVFDRNEYKCTNLQKKYNITIVKSLIDTVNFADVIILAIKPQNMSEVIKNIKDVITTNQIIISVAAGIKTNAYEMLFNKDISFARTIPNTPSSLGYGATGIYFNNNITNEKKDIVIKIMQTIGLVVVVDNEKDIDVISAIASSGPAYYFQFMEHMINSAIKQGLDKNQAEKLVVQTCLGAAQMALNNNYDITTLRKNVTSKKGITYEALNIFEQYKLDEIIDKAIQSNINRGQELSLEFSKSIKN
ncbi:MAG: pyrroline-5-carboxylate reductase [Francisella sp.]